MVFKLNTEIYRVNLSSLSKNEKLLTRKNSEWTPSKLENDKIK